MSSNALNVLDAPTIQKIKTKRRTPCPRGTRRNPKTGLCVPVTIKPVPVSVSVEPVPVEPVPVEPVPVEPVEPAPAAAAAEEVSQLTNKFKQELLERDDLIKNKADYDFLYPNLNDPQFNTKISERKEFNDNRYDGEIYPDVEAQSELLCNAEFELAPHQLFVRNFLSFQTPYNSLLLYHGLGSGKTCSAISVAEEMRDYIMQMGITSQIMIVASPNVQVNFKTQLFDDRKLKLIDGIWNLRSCTGNKFLKEINPLNMKGLTKENVIKQINRIIDTYYKFFGYVEFANYISKKSIIDDPSITDPKLINTIKKNKLRKVFSNRLIIIDEVHNIRVTDDNKDKRVAAELMTLIKHVSTLRLLLLSATPMFNSYKEIIWLINVMNANDRRATIEAKDVFNKDGSFKISSTGQEIGKELLERKATGYISFVRGENPYTFPYRIFPKEFAPEQTFPNKQAPTMQLNGTMPLTLAQNIEHLSLYLVDIGEYQQLGYNYIIQRLKGGHIGNNAQMPNLENIETFGYTMLQQPIEGLNIIYPDERLENDKVPPTFKSQDLVGSEGLKRIMTFIENPTTHSRSKFDYNPATIVKYGRIFSPQEIGKYSNKIKTICDRIIQAKGIILVYSQYIDAGLVPIALALEELGFARAGNVGSLFAKPPVGKRNGLNYVMITGDKGFSPDPATDIKLLTDEDNKDGHKVKVALISQTGAEGLDLSNIRQVHILEPWYNMNRTEQIIGRAVRTCSHKALPFSQRNVEIYLYASLMREEGREETADLYVYRLAELKAIQIGKISRILKEISIDCILNHNQINFTEENMEKNGVKPVTLQLASGKKLENYKIGDKPFSSICDYMESCDYMCRPNKEINEDNVRMDTYNEDFIMTNTDKLIYKIKNLMKDRVFYRKSEIIVLLNTLKSYPLVQINAALHQLVEDKNEYITDKYGRLGHLINISDLYLFQPLELTDERSSIYDRSNPLDVKHDNVIIKLPRDLKVNEAVINIKENKIEEHVVGEKKNDDLLLQLKRKIQTNYTLAINKQKLIKGEKNWYMFCHLAIDFLVKNMFERNILIELIAEHIVDELSLADINLLLNDLPNAGAGTGDNATAEGAAVFKQIKTYLEKQMMVVKNGLKGFLWKHNGKQAILVKGNGAAGAGTGAGVWHNAEPEDVKDFLPKLTERKTNIIANLNNIIGFMNNFKTEEYVVFKTKDITNTRDIGARCDQNSNKGKAIAILNSIVGSDQYSTELNISQREICIIQELYLRFFDRTKRNKKRWFLSPPDAVLINIEKYTSTATKKPLKKI